jgi:hypothetical protein
VKNRTPYMTQEILPGGAVVVVMVWVKIKLIAVSNVNASSMYHISAWGQEYLAK